MRGSTRKISFYVAAIGMIAFANPLHSSNVTPQNGMQNQNLATSPSMVKISQSLESEAESFKSSNGKTKFQLNPNNHILENSFFSRYSQSLKLGKDDEMKIQNTSGDFQYQNQSNSISYYQQFYKGIPVLGSSYKLMKNSQGYVVNGNGNIISNINIDTNPVFLENAAFNNAKTAIAAESYEWDKDPKKFPKGNLVIFTKDSKQLLAWKFVINTEGPKGSYSVYIDANSGVLIEINSNWMEVEENIACTGSSRYDGTVSFIGTKQDDSYYQLSCDPANSGPTCPVKIEMYDVRKPNTQDGGNDELSYFWNSANNTDFEDVNDVLGVSIAWGIQKTLEFYKKFNWISFDGKGKVQIDAYLEEIIPPNAHYDGNSKSLHFGSSGSWDQNGYITCPQTGPVLSLSTIGHEFTHGVIDHSSKLRYVGESGALNEAFADIFGELVQTIVAGKALTWKIGYDECNGGFYRNMADPKSTLVTTTKYPLLPPHDPDTYNGLYFVDTKGPCTTHCVGYPNCDDSAYNDRCGVHINSSIINHWFYLLVKGGQGTNDLGDNYKVDSIPIEDAAYISFYTMIYELNQDASFMDARLGSIEVAEKQFGKTSVQAQSVTNAWYAVGVGAPYEQTQYLPLDGATNVILWNTQLSYESDPKTQDPNIEFQIASDENFTLDVQSLAPTKSTLNAFQKSSLALDIMLKPNTHYYWRIHHKQTSPTPNQNTTPSGGNFITKGLSQLSSTLSSLFQSNTNQNSNSSNSPSTTKEWGSIHEFTTALPSAQSTSPGMGSTITSLNGVTLAWQPDHVGNSTDIKYHVQLAQDPQFNALVLEKDVLNAGTSLSIQLSSSSQPYYWRVRPEAGSYGVGKYSPIATFKVDLSASKPSGMKPIETDPSVQFQDSVEFVWSKVNGASGYNFSIRSASGNTPLQEISLSLSAVTEVQWQNTASISYKNGTFSIDPQGYCWKVQAVGANNVKGPYSDEKCYTSGPSPVTSVYPSNGSVIDEAVANSLPAGYYSWKSDRAPWGFRVQLCQTSCNIATQNTALNSPFPGSLLDVFVPAGTFNYPFRRDLMSDGKIYQLVVYPLGHDGRIMSGKSNGFSTFTVKYLQNHNKPNDPNSNNNNSNQGTCSNGETKNAQGICECKVPGTPSVSPTFSVYDTVSTAAPDQVNFMVSDSDPFVSWSYQSWKFEPSSLSWQSAGGASYAADGKVYPLANGDEYYRIYYYSFAVQNQCGKQSASVGSYYRPVPPGEGAVDPGFYPTPPSFAMQQRMSADTKAQVALKNYIVRLQTPRKVAGPKVQVKQVQDYSVPSSSTLRQPSLLPVLQKVLK